MAADYRMLLGWGQLGPQLPNPMSLASMRMDLDKQRMAMDTALEQQQRERSLRALMPQAFTPEGLNQQVAQQIVGLGGAEQLRAAQQALMPEVTDPQFYGEVTGFNPETGKFEKGQFSRLGGIRFSGIEDVGYETPQQKAERQEAERLEREQREDKRGEQKIAVTRAQENAEKFNTADRTLAEMEDLINEYEAQLDRYGTGILPEAELDSAYSQLLVNYNAAVAKLGALAGDDVKILEKVLTPPRSIKGAAYGKEGLKNQIAMARRRITSNRQRLKNDLLGGKEPGAVAPAGAAPAQPAPKLRFDPATGNLVPVK